MYAAILTMVFQNEINTVLYSYLGETEKLGTRSFEEFIIEKTKTINLSINSLKEQINNLNIRIIDLEGKVTKLYYFFTNKKY